MLKDIALVKYLVSLSPENRQYATVVICAIILILTVRHYEIKETKQQYATELRVEKVRSEKNVEMAKREGKLEAKLELCNEREQESREREREDLTAFKELYLETDRIKKEIKN